MGEVCARCRHVGHPTRAVGRLQEAGPIGYIGPDHAPIRATRAEAERDVCNERRNDEATRGPHDERGGR